MNDQLEYFTGRVAAGKMSRRDFMGKAAALGISTALASTITLTPGTVSCDLAADGHAILVHALHAPDPDAVRDDIKARYERRLKEIFE